MGLNESYSAIRAQILLMKPIPSITEVLSLLIQEERQRSAGILELPPSSDPVTLAVGTSPKNSSPADRSRRKDSQRLVCTHCNIKGHVVERCYKLHGYPPGYKFRSSTPDVSASSAQPCSNPKSINAANSVAANAPDFFSSLNSSQYS